MLKVGRTIAPLGKSTSRVFIFFSCLAITALIVLPNLFQIAHAQELTARSLAVASASPSVVTTHTFTFTPSSVTAIGSIVFEYCQNSPVVGQPCDVPPGLDVSLANLSIQTGNTGFSVDNLNTTANKLVITRSPSVGISVVSSYVFSNITNPSNAPHSEFIRISTHASTDGSGSLTDNGSVAYAIHTPLNVAAYVPPFLNFCVGVTVSLDCSVTNGDSIDMGIISKTIATSATSQFSTATNDPTGYVVYAIGNTMTSGNNIIPALASPSPSQPGTSQFGINLRDNSSPNIGTDPSGVGTGIPTAGYNSPNAYTFNSGDSLAASTLSSEYTRMTVSYLVNAANSQPPGVYTATFTYLATVQF